MTWPLSFVHEAGVIVPKVTRILAGSGAGIFKVSEKRLVDRSPGHLGRLHSLGLERSCIPHSAGFSLRPKHVSHGAACERSRSRDRIASCWFQTTAPGQSLRARRQKCTL